MKKTMLVIGAVGAMMLVGGCAKGHQGSTNMGAVSGSTCSEKKECCSKDKAAMGAVSGSTCSEKKACCNKDKAAMGAVSGSSCSEKKDCASKCSSAK